MNWGHGLMIFFGGFVLLMVSLVIICMKQDDIHLVTQNYYEEEIRYQQQLDKMENARGLDYQAIRYQSGDKTVDLNLPEGAEGTLHLFRPSDARLDQKFMVKMDKRNPFTVNLAHLQPGYWKLKLSWKEGDRAYYVEKQITI